jgi:hypothetical protein
MDLAAFPGTDPPGCSPPFMVKDAARKSQPFIAAVPGDLHIPFRFKKRGKMAPIRTCQANEFFIHGQHCAIDLAEWQQKPPQVALRINTCYS